MSGCVHMNPDDFCASCAPDKLKEARAEVERLRIGNAALAANVRVAEAVVERQDAAIAALVDAGDRLESYTEQLELLVYDIEDKGDAHGRALAGWAEAKRKAGV